jgi:hypothetical protein
MELDINESHRLLEQMEESQPEIVEKAEILTADVVMMIRN